MSSLELLIPWLKAAELEEDLLFRRVRGGGAAGESALSHQAIWTIIESRAEATGLEGRVSGHSPRVGTAQSLAAQGATVIEMQQTGRWESPIMLGNYGAAPDGPLEG